MKKRRVCWAKVSAHPERTPLLLDQPLTPGNPRSPYIRGPEPVCQTSVSVFHCCRRSRMALNNSHPIVITSPGAGAGRVSAAVTPRVSPAVQLVAARAEVILRFFYPHVCGLWLSAEVSAGAASQNICTWPLQGPCFLITVQIMLRARVPRWGTRRKLDHLYHLACGVTSAVLTGGGRNESLPRFKGRDVNSPWMVEGQDVMRRRTWVVGDASFWGRLGESFLQQSACFSSLQASSEDRLAVGESPGRSQGLGAVWWGVGQLCSGQRPGPLTRLCQGQVAWRAGQALWMRFEEPPPRATCGQGRGQLLRDQSDAAAEQEGPKGRRETEINEPLCVHQPPG